MPSIRCVDCLTPYPETGLPYHCPACGGIYDFDGPPVFEPRKLEDGLPGYWRYRHAFSLVDSAPIITLGEGNTPLIWMEDGKQSVGFKMEHLNPTGSYKDRGSAVLVSQLIGRGATKAVEDSSGNAGASFAAYAARGGLKARVFVPETASGPKRVQIESVGAELIPVPGPRSEAARAVLAEADSGVPYASHAFLPFGLAGIATIAYEIWEEIGGVPGTIIVPVGHGGLLLGIVRGFAALKKENLIDRVPYYVAVQAENCAPMLAASRGGLEAMQSITEGPTIAEGVRVRWPVRVKATLNEIAPQNRMVIGINDEDVLQAFHYLPKRGIHVEPTSALVWAAYSKYRGNLPAPVIMILTGSGLKSSIS
jgi:threonine synthase